MKSYNGLYTRMIEQAECEASIVEAAKGKMKRRDVKETVENKATKSATLIRKMESGKLVPPSHKKYALREGSHKKERIIEKPQFCDEQIVHHMLVRQLKPIIMPRLYTYAYGSIPKRGTHAATRTLVRWRDSYGGKKFYVAELDVKGFYDNVDVDILKAMLHKKIRDKRFLQEVDKVIDASAPGLPKGFFTSPWFAHFYLTPMDNYITQVLKPDHYLRYVDNMYLFHRNKKELHRMIEALSTFMWQRLRLRIKGDWQVFRMEHRDKDGNAKGRAINSLGFVIHADHVGIRKAVLERIRAKANRMYRKHRCTRYDAASILSRLGYFKYANAYGYYLKWIKPKVSIHYCKRRLSTLARKERIRNDRIQNCA